MKPGPFVQGAFVIVALAVTVYRYRRGRFRLVDTVFWSAVWSAALVGIAFPETTVFVARVLGIGRGVDAAIYLSVVLSFYVMFRLYTKIDRMQGDITAIVRHLALSERDPRPR